MSVKQRVRLKRFDYSLAMTPRGRRLMAEVSAMDAKDDEGIRNDALCMQRLQEKLFTPMGLRSGANSLKWWESAADDPDVDVYVIRRGNPLGIVAFAMVEHRREVRGAVSELVILGTDYDYQSHGFGAALITVVAANSPSKVLQLEVRSTNPVQEWYRRLGFVEVSSAPRRKDGDYLLQMEVLL